MQNLIDSEEEPVHQPYEVRFDFDPAAAKQHGWIPGTITFPSGKVIKFDHASIPKGYVPPTWPSTRKVDIKIRHVAYTFKK